ncbi:amino acid permease [Arthrobacter sp. NPDC090010]|uniref:amino acid permease n=1 Tax=Arthrobacter sp. NPDC090010 TaxID=3363942 RepID=UPI0038230976
MNQSYQQSRHDSARPSSPATAGAPAGSELQRRLSTRHIRFIALGSAIGTGLFYGSSETIRAAGPAVLVAYIVAGAMVFIVMRALGEMAVRHPVAGSFAQYADRYISPLAGFLTGWVFAFEMLMVAIADMVAAGKYMGLWFPNTPGWVWMLAGMLIICALNLLKVSVFGELEFWFSLIKVVTIIAMIVGGIGLIVFGVSTGGVQPGLNHLVDHGGFAPFGVWGIVMSLGIVVFSFGGVETLGMTAGETGDPGKAIPKAVNSVPFRILIFYILSLGVMFCLFPWNQIGSQGSPFVQVFTGLHIPAAEHIINGVVLTAALSAMNAISYTLVRTLYGLAQQGQAPRSFLRLSRTGVPYLPVSVVLSGLVLGLLAFLLIPDTLFLLVASIASFATVFTWVMILVSHYRMRRELRDAPARGSAYRMPAWPWLSWIALVFMAFVVVVLLSSSTGQVAVAVGLGLTAVLTAIYLLAIRPRHPERIELAVAEDA